MIIIRVAESLGGKEYYIDPIKWSKKLVGLLKNESMWTPKNNQEYMVKVADILQDLVPVDRIEDKDEIKFVKDLIRVGVLEKIDTENKNNIINLFDKSK